MSTKQAVNQANVPTVELGTIPPEKFENLMATLADDRTMTVHDPNVTIPVPPPDTSPSFGSVALPRFMIDGDVGDATELAFGDTIGEGGMGLVRLAVQVPLGREVAVKTLKRQGADSRHKQELLREAWLTGALEHPNIIPVYALGQDAQGGPVLVMKKVEGTTWREFLDKPEMLEEKGVQDSLNWHLKLLLQVCNALRFAHSRGILHRDIKPENVMVGAFDEVYLLDWGIAVSLNEADGGRLPLAKKVDNIAGTPIYLAPEMAAGHGPEIRETADIYLLGAVLHELVSGDAPHRAKTLMEVLRLAYASEPKSYGASVPAELGAIANKAMSVKPADRFQSVDDFQRALESFLEHRGSLALSGAALRRIPELLEGIEKRKRGQVDDDLEQVFGECQFAFRQALKSWPDNVEAREGLKRALEAMIEIEILERNLGAAQRLLSNLPAANPELKQRISELAEVLAKEKAEADHLRDKFDRKTGAKARITIVLWFAVFWAVFPLLAGQAFRAGYVTTWPFVINTLLFLGMVVAYTYWTWDLLKSSLSNRTYVMSLYGLWAVVFMHRVSGVLQDVPLKALLVQEMLIYGLMILLSGILVDSGLILGGLIYLVFHPLFWLFDDWTFEIIGVTNGLSMLSVAWAWKPLAKEECEVQKAVKNSFEGPANKG